MISIVRAAARTLLYNGFITAMAHPSPLMLCVFELVGLVFAILKPVLLSDGPSPAGAA